MAGAVALGRWWEFVGSRFSFGLGWHESVIAGSGDLFGVFLFLVVFVGCEAGDELEAFEAFGKWGVDVFGVFGSPSSHPFVDIFGLVELAYMSLDGSDGFFDVFFFEWVPVAASFTEHHDPDFVDFPRFEALSQETFVPQVVARGGEYGGECGFTSGEVVGMADVVGVREVACRVCGDEDVGPVFPDYADDFTAEGDGRFEVAVWEVEEFDGFETEYASGVGLFLLSDSAELGGRDRPVLGAFGSVGAHDVDDFPSESTPFCDGSGASPVGVVGVCEDDHCTGMFFLFGREGFGIGGHALGFVIRMSVLRESMLILAR